MKKYIPLIIIPIIIAIIGFILYNNRTVTSITMDINPSIRINLNKKDEVKSIIPLNDDAKKITNIDIKGKHFEEALKDLTKAVVDTGYAKDRVVIILYSEGKIESEEIGRKLAIEFDELDIQVEFIQVEEVTKEDKKLAKKYDITPAKAAYINSIQKENENIDITALVEKPIEELQETKARGIYCDSDYTLEGDFCTKAIGKEASIEGLICPNGYREHNGKCYAETRYTEGEKLVCNEHLTLKDNKCYLKEIIDAEPVKYSCPSGEAKTMLELGRANPNDGNAKDVTCVDYSSATHPVSPCEANDGTEYTMAGGKCYWHRAPVIAEGCPGKVQVNGECWDDATGIYICVGYRDGKRYSSKDEYCENSIKYIDPIITEYKCSDDFVLEGNKCTRERIEEPYHERLCQEGYTLVDNDICLNLSKEAPKEEGLYCENEHSKLINNECIIYEWKDAIHS